LITVRFQRFESSDMSIKVSHRMPLLILMVAAALSGCSLMSSSALPFAKKKEPEFLTPRQIVPVWSDTVLHQPDEPATRGFGGRIMFYGVDKHKPIRVDGTLVVYAWDDSNGPMERAPDRKYVFPGRDLQTHYSESRLGHSYSFWVPWDAAGGPLKHLTLITRFVGNEGTELTSNPAHVVLQGPGPGSPFANERNALNEASVPGRKSRAGRIQQASHTEIFPEDSSADADDQESEFRSGGIAPQKRVSGIQTSEIDLTSGFFSRNMRQSRVFVDDDSRSEGTKLNVDAKSLLTSTSEMLKGQSSIEPNDTDARSESEADSGSPAADLSPFESRVRASRAARSSGGHVRKEPLRATWPIGLPQTPRSKPRETE
jgi:hypothetical protein